MTDVNVKTIAIIYTIAAAVCSSTVSYAKSEVPMPGKVLSELVCARCHDVTNRTITGRPPVQGAPPSFRQIADDSKMTAPALYQFLRFPHGTMEHLFLTQQEADSLIAYIQTLKSSKDETPR